MEDVLARNATQHYGAGRGIVMVAGNADTLQRVKWTLMMLRGYGCGLPVQIVSAVQSVTGRC
jgi:alpha 1,2-mannosyltransferase